MDTNKKQLQYAQGDLFKAILSLEDNIKDGIREINIYKDAYKDYTKKGGVVDEDITKVNNTVEFILNELHIFKAKVFE
jgi:hypothetical protein